jgi:hypothetical protein
VLQVKALGSRLGTLIAVGCIEIADRQFLRRNKQIKILENTLYNTNTYTYKNVGTPNMYL